MTKNELIERINKELDHYDSKKDRSRNFAIGIKLLTAVLGAAVTVLLGWKTSNESYKEWFPNVALICGAIVAVMNSIDSFFSFSAKWSNYKEACTDLIFLRYEIEKVKEDDWDGENYYNTYLKILRDAKKAGLPEKPKSNT